MIQINNLAFSYGSTEVLRNISMNLEPGRIYGLLGENGVGKTTLLTLLCGLKKCGAGTIDIDGRDPYRRDPGLLSELCYLPDEVAPENDRAASWAAGRGRFWPGFTMERFYEIMRVFENDPSKKMNGMQHPLHLPRRTHQRARHTLEGPVPHCNPQVYAGGFHDSDLDPPGKGPRRHHRPHHHT